MVGSEDEGFERGAEGGEEGLPAGCVLYDCSGRLLVSFVFQLG